MAHTVQARKRIRQNQKRAEQNTTQRSRMRTFIKKLEQAIDAGEKDVISPAFQNAMRELHKCARKGVVSKGAANRKISRLAAAVRRAS